MSAIPATIQQQATPSNNLCPTIHTYTPIEAGPIVVPVSMCSDQLHQPQIHLQGRWKPQENHKFWKGIKKYGKNWSKLQEYIKTRTVSQIRSHAQKILYKHKHAGAKVSDIAHLMALPENYKIVSSPDGEGNSTSKFQMNELLKMQSRLPLNEIYYILMNLVKNLNAEIQLNNDLQKVHQIVKLILEYHDKLCSYLKTITPLEPIELRNLASLNGEVEAISIWHHRLNIRHLDFTNLKYIYGKLLFRIIDIDKYCFLSMIRKTTSLKTPSPNGFISYQK